MTIFKGFTIIELMITVAILAILATIAFPSFQNAFAKSDRTTAITDIGDISLALERFYSQNRVYTNDFGGINMGNAGSANIQDTNLLYTYTITLTTAQSYTINAVPNKSRDIWTLMQDHLGVRTHCNTCPTPILNGWP